jgi:putative ABC transport system permease protein
MRLTRFFRRNRRDDETAREIASYIAIETDDNIGRGMTREAAHDAAVRKFGNATLVREDIYNMNTLTAIDNLLRDLRFGARLLWRDKGFAAAAIVSLALGIGANTAIFQLLDTVRLRVLPVAEPGELVNVSFAPGSSRNGRFSSRWGALTFAQVEEIRARQQTFRGLGVWSSGTLNTADGGEVKNVEALWASGDLFSVLGVSAAIGRVITPDDDERGCPAPVAVVSYAYWQRQFGGAPSVLDQAVRLQGVRFPIVGVTEPRFFGLEVGRQFDVAVPLCADLLLQNGVNRFESRREWWLAAVGRLAPGRTRQSANDHLIGLSPRLTQVTLPPGYSADDEKAYLGFKLNALPFENGASNLREQFGEPLVVLLAATTLVLVIACANLANLLLAKATAREREIAIRLSIGASRARIMRQLLAESVLLAAIGTTLGVLVARGLGQVLVAQLAGGAGSVFVDLTWNMKVFGFTAGVSLLACLLFGLAPAAKATALSPAVVLKAGGRGITGGRSRFGVRRVLVVTQVALSLVLLFGALLFTRTLYNLLTIDPGFNQDVITVDATHRTLATDDPARGYAQRQDLQARLAAIPGVAGVALSENMPLAGGFWNEFVMVDGAADKALANFARVGSDFFALLDIPVVRGRTFSVTDSRNAPPVALVNERFVEKTLGGADPVGRRLWVIGAPGQPEEKIEIIGVTRDTKYGSIREELQPLVYVPIAQAEAFGALARFAVKARGPVAGLMPSIERAVAEVNPAIAVRTRVARQVVRSGLVRERLMAALSGAFGVLAALLAAVGLYGVLSYTVMCRANEIGIRLAMGASRATVLRMVLAESGWLVGTGLVIGLVMALGAARAARSLLFGLQPADPATVAAAAALLAAIGLVATYLPARRASRVDPMNVLRQE